MRNQHTYWHLLSIGAITCALILAGGKLNPKSQAGEEEGENPGWFSQWLEEKKPANGVFPRWMRSQWAAWDKSQLIRRGKNPIIDTVIELGPKSTGGRTRALWIDPRNENIILAGAVSGGLWRSENAGVSWKPVNDFESSLSVTSITASPFNPDIVYYSTGEGRGNSADLSGGGIFKSTDGGKTFSVLPSTVGKTGFDVIWKITHSLNDSNTLFVATDAMGLFRSTDGGDSWQQVYSGGNKQVTEVIALPNNRIIASMQGSLVVASDSGGKSGTFTTVTFSNPPGNGQYRRIQMAYCKKYPSVVYALFEGYATSYTDVPVRFYKSSNYGRTWVSKSTPSAIGSGQMGYCTMIGAHPTDSNYVVTGAIYIAQTSNGGSSWSSKTTGHSDHHGFAAFSNGSYLIGCDGGIYKYSWTNGSPTNLNTGYQVTQFYAGNFGPTGMVAISGTQDNGTHVSTGYLKTQKFYGADGAYAHIGLQDGTVAYFSTQNEGIRRIDNFNSNLIPSFTTAIDDAAFTTDGVDFINAYTINPGAQEQLYYRTNKYIYRSTSSGDAWDAVAKRAGIKALATSAETDPVLYFGGTAGQLYKLENAATVDVSSGFKEVNFNANVPVEVTDDVIKGITVHPKDKYCIYIALSNYSTKSRVWKATGLNTSTPVFKNIGGNLPAGLPVNSIAVDPANPDQNFFAGTDFGLYYTVDSGKTWSKETRIPNVAVFEVKMRDDRSLFAFTHGRGMFYLALVGGNSAGIKSAAQTASVRVWPNPASDRLYFEIPNQAAATEYAIYTLHARVIQSGNLPAGEKSLPVTAVPEGYYFIRLQNGANTFTQKILIRH